MSRSEGECRKWFKITPFQACFVMVTTWIFLYLLRDTKEPSNQDTRNFNKVVKVTTEAFRSFSYRPEITRKRMLVLLWKNDYYQTGNWLPSTLDLQCPVTDCDTTSNISLLNKSSAVILHWRSIDTKDLPSCNQSSSEPCPLWVLYNREAPPHTSVHTLRDIEGKIHWTATYRRDSDLFAPYGIIVRRDKPQRTRTVFNPNKRLVCWLVSNCNTPSNREEFVSELEEYIDVDIYGECGNMHCPLETSSDCYRWLSKRCLFYLSLENSLCKDYTTEKLYQALSTDMIPVVMGNASKYSHLPSRSYINALDFAEPRELAEYLIKVGRNGTLYQSYLDWKKYYEAKDHSYKWFCDLCARLHSTDIRRVEPRKELVSWWYSDSHCWSWKNSNH